MPSYTPDQIDDANLAYHYTGTDYGNAAGGVYYRLKTATQGFPAGFWASQRSQAPVPIASSSQQVFGASYLQSSASTNTIVNYRQKLVSTFRVVAHTIGPVMPGAAVSQNHWTIYLLVPGGSVQLNMKTNINASISRGIFEVREHAYEQSNSAVRYFDLPAAQGVLVDYVEREIRSQRWDQYNMNENGVGCRWWILTVMRGLGQKNYVNPSKVESELVPALEYNYSRNLTPIKLEMKQGTFC
ncbi:hypothetical protein PMIN02_010558 [Paraphaeosphaeria minitans]